MRVRVLFSLAAVLALALPGAAHAGGGFGVTPAAQSFQAGTGSSPDIAVDPAGTAHVVWDDKTTDVTSADPIHYCRIPRGATACSKETVLNPPLNSIGHSTHVFVPSAGRVLIEAYRCCGGAEGNYLYESTDGGETFGPARVIGKLDHHTEAVFGPGEAISGSGISTFQRMPLSGAAASTHAEFNAGFPIPTHSGLGIFNGTTPVLVMSDGDHTSFVVNQGGDPNSSASWTAATPLDPPGGEPRVAGGPAGLVLVYTLGTPGARALEARKFDGSGFGAPVKVSETSDPIFADLWAEPSTGEFHAFWTANGVVPNELRWSRSKDGVTWSQPQAVLAGDVADNAFNLQVSAAPDEEGFAVWDTNSNPSQVRVVPLKPSAGGGGGDGTDGSATTPADTVTVGGQQLTLLTPAGCVNPGVPIKLRVTSKTKRLLSPKRRVKIVYVLFSLDKKKKKDKKAAFKATLKTAGLAAGSTHKLGAKVRLRPVIGKGKRKTKKLKGTLTICG